MAKRKVKNEVWYTLILIGIVIFIVAKCFSFVMDYKYKHSYEYKLTEIGYSVEEAKQIQKVFKTDKELDYILSIDADEEIINIINEKYFINKNFKKYLKYMNNNKSADAKKIVTTINTHRDQPFYSLDLKTDTSKQELMLVNKYYSLNEDYSPKEIVDVSNKFAWGNNGDIKLEKIAYDAYLKMHEAALKDEIYLMLSSGYRNYEDQDAIYNRYVNYYGTSYAEKNAARAGCSEHQTGLALDIFSKTNTNKATFYQTTEAKWLKDNAYKYGFILRYDEGKENITGGSYESWHYRYVGIDAAEYIHKNDITFEEYYAYFVEKED